MIYYKVLNEDGTSCHGGSGRWPLPVDGTPGEWIEVPGPIFLCEAGTLHLCRRQDVIYWLGPCIYEAETGAAVVIGADKIGTTKARLLRLLPWDEWMARLFACDCAERALALLRMRGLPLDPRSSAAVQIARRYAEGQATVEELTAARAVAWAAARAANKATEVAARAAAWTTAEVANEAAEAAAEAAARTAARAANEADEVAARAVARAANEAERTWQTERLFQYLYPLRFGS